MSNTQPIVSSAKKELNGWMKAATEATASYLVNHGLNMLITMGKRAILESTFATVILAPSNDHRENFTQRRFIQWVTEQPKLWNTAQFQLKRFLYDGDANDGPLKRAEYHKQESMRLTPANERTHFFFYKEKLFWYQVTSTTTAVTKQNASLGVDNALTMVGIQTFRTNANLLQDLLAEFSYKENHDRIPVFGSMNLQPGMRYINEFTALSPKTLAHSQQEIQSIFDDIHRVFSNHDEYDRCGYNWKYNILLVGKPGTGKTSLAKVIASYLRMPMNFIDLANSTSDSLISNSNMLTGELIFMDEIDMCAGVHCRPEMADQRLPEFRKEVDWGTLLKRSTTGDVLQPTCPDLSTILSFLGGMYTPRGCIMIIATNRPEVLDPAITRKGRVDRIIFMDDSTHEDLVPYVEFLFGQKVPSNIRFATINGAVLSDIVNSHRHSFDAFIKALPKA